MSTSKPLYGAKTAMTVTLASLASAALRSTLAVDNTTTLYEDVLVSPIIVTGASTTGKIVNLYAYGSDGGGTPAYTDGIAGTDAAVTPPSPPNLRFLKALSVPAASTTYEPGPVSVAKAFGGILPDHWGLVFENLTGVALGASGSSCSFQGVNRQSV